MIRRAGCYGGLCLALCHLSACQTPPQPTHDQIVSDLLAQILATQRPACGAVSVYSRSDRLDYRVECASGQVYRVRVNGSGHVLIIAGDGS